MAETTLEGSIVQDWNRPPAEFESPGFVIWFFQMKGKFRSQDPTARPSRLFKGIRNHFVFVLNLHFVQIILMFRQSGHKIFLLLSTFAKILVSHISCKFVYFFISTELVPKMLVMMMTMLVMMMMMTMLVTMLMIHPANLW